jgi:DNA invertase Pin-like site-specific DNA recombinase
MLPTMNTACAYYRTSSATNVGTDKDSLKRQQDAVRAYAGVRGLEVEREFYDAAVSGADPVASREGFSEMLTYMLGNGARIVLVENASRFARDLVVQITGHTLLKKHGIELIPVDAPTHFTEDSPTATMVRAVLGAVAEFEKNSLVARLRKARNRIRIEKGRCEGNPAWLAVPTAHIEAAKAANKRKLTMRAIAAELAERGFKNRNGNTYAAQSIARMLRAQQLAEMALMGRVPDWAEQRDPAAQLAELAESVFDRG